MALKDLTKKEAVAKLQQILEVLPKVENPQEFMEWLSYYIFYDDLESCHSYQNEFDNAGERSLILTLMPDYYPKG